MIWIACFIALLMYLFLGCVTLVAIQRQEVNSSFFPLDVFIVLFWPILIIAIIIAVLFLLLRNILGEIRG